MLEDGANLVDGRLTPQDVAKVVAYRVAGGGRGQIPDATAEAARRLSRAARDQPRQNGGEAEPPDEQPRLEGQGLPTGCRAAAGVRDWTGTSSSCGHMLRNMYH